VSPNTARWQQQINSSFEALVNGALLSPHSADLSHRAADCSDWRYAVEDLRGVCPTIDDLRKKDWSLRHMEQRSDSRDSGLESDAAVDRHSCFTKKCQTGRSTKDRRSLHATFDCQRNEQLMPYICQPNTVHPSNSPTQLHMFTEAENCQLYGGLSQNKIRAALTMRHHVNSDELTNGFAGYIPHTQDISGMTSLRHNASVFSVHDVSRPLSSKSKCFTA